MPRLNQMTAVALSDILGFGLGVGGCGLEGHGLGRGGCGLVSVITYPDCVIIAAFFAGN